MDKIPGEEKELLATLSKMSRSYRVTDGASFLMTNIDPKDTGGVKGEGKETADETLKTIIAQLARMQEILYAQAKWGVLMIFQAMDAGGKDSCVKHVLSGINPQGCRVVSFKPPSDEELRHDFMWRCVSRLPERGQIGVFNRSYYEEVLAPRVHPEYLPPQNIPDSLVGQDFWKNRYEDINAFERFLTRNGFVVLKFMLHLSKGEQRRRFLKRLDDPAKNWKYTAADLTGRERWSDYQKAYEDMIRATATNHAPWYVVPANNKWFTRQMVASALMDALQGLDLKYPEVTDANRQMMEVARATLKSEES